MPRLPYAARTLIDQMGERYKNLDYKMDDVDGLGVARTITFENKNLSKFLERAREALDSDARVESFEMKSGKAAVTFVPSRLADYRERFPLEAAAELADEE